MVIDDAGEHDEALAATSHLPHLIASALALATPKDLLPLAASGWRDTTRIAGGDPELWRAIFDANRAGSARRARSGSSAGPANSARISRWARTTGCCGSSNGRSG